MANELDYSRDMIIPEQALLCKSVWVNNKQLIDEDGNFIGISTSLSPSDITDQTQDNSPSSDDLLLTVNDPSGTPALRKVAIGDLVTTPSVFAAGLGAHIRFNDSEWGYGSSPAGAVSLANGQSNKTFTVYFTGLPVGAQITGVHIEGSMVGEGGDATSLAAVQFAKIGVYEGSATQESLGVLSPGPSTETSALIDAEIDLSSSPETIDNGTYQLIFVGSTSTTSGVINITNIYFDLA